MLAFICFFTVVVLLAVLGHSWSRLLRNYLRARKSGLPIVVSPIDTSVPIWRLADRWLRPYLLALPDNLFPWAQLCYFGWQFDNKHKIHQKYGLAFWHVKSGKNELIIADPAAVAAILNRRKEFIKPEEFYDALDIFGPNVATGNGMAWERHRKIVAPCFNERVSSLVWNEASTQASAMISSCLPSHPGPRSKESNTVVRDAQIIALHVLSTAGFGESHPFHGGFGVADPDSGHKMSYCDALRHVLDNLMFHIVSDRLPFLRRKWLVTRRLREVLAGANEFRRYLEEMVASEQVKQPTLGSEHTKYNNFLMSNLVRSSNSTKIYSHKLNSLREGLSDEELYGNMFIINIAGHETTASTIAYAIILLALHPEWQEWAREEVIEVFKDSGNGDYESSFPRLKRLLAIMYETLRLYAPIEYLPRAVAVPTYLTFPSVSSKPVLIDPSVNITCNIQGLHTSPASWSSAAPPLTFHPARFLSSDHTAGSSDAASLSIPNRDTFMGFAHGPRSCPGMKFAQVEFVSVLSQMLYKARVRPAGARSELEACLNDSGYSGVTLTLNQPKKVRLAWERV